jgi:ribosomal protein L11
MKSVYGAILSGTAFVLIASPQTAWADATPECNVGATSASTECGVDSIAGEGATATGTRSTATGQYATATGFDSRATGTSATAIGFLSNASGPFSTAAGSGSTATEDRSTALGYGSSALGVSSTASGAGSIAIGQNSTATGTDSTARGINSTALGSLASAIGDDSTATGNESRAEGLGSAAFGVRSVAVAGDSTAIGGHSVAIGLNSTALGAYAVANEDNTVSVGNDGSTPGLGGAFTRRIVNMADGINATDAATVGQMNAANAVQDTRMTAIEAVNSAQDTRLSAIDALNSTQNGRLTALEALSGPSAARLTALESGLTALNASNELYNRQASGGIAAAMAMGGTIIPADADGAVSFNLATYRGEQGFSGIAVIKAAPKIYFNERRSIVAKKIEGYIKLQVPAGSANAVTADRPCAGSARREHHGILQGVQRRPRRTWKRGMPIPTIITVYADRSRSPFVTKTPPASYLIKKAAGLKSGSKEPGKVSAGTIKRSQLAEIAQTKFADLNANDIEQADQDHRRLCPLDGPRRGGGLRSWLTDQKAEVAGRKAGRQSAALRR